MYRLSPCSVSRTTILPPGKPTKPCSTAFWTSSLMINAHEVACWAGSVKLRLPSRLSVIGRLWSSTPLRTSARIRFETSWMLDARLLVAEKLVHHGNRDDPTDAL